MNRKYLLTTLFLFALSITFLPAQQFKSLNRIDALHYTFEIEIQDVNDQIKANADILFRVKQSTLDTIFLDLIQKDLSGEGMTVSSVQLNDEAVNFFQESEHLVIIPKDLLQKGYVATLHIIYQGVPTDGLIISENEYGERTFFGDNWPNRARFWLPVIDHPSDKATNEFKIIAPAHYKVVANGVLREESSLGLNQKVKKNFTHWVNDTPIPTKVMVFGAARFAVQYDYQFQNIPIQHWVYADNRGAGYEDFEPTANILHYMSNTIGAYPFQKLANVESKTKYGGMENASNIFYNEQAVDGQKKIENLIAHEVAHQWFGNAVTEKSWEHIWLSEGFSTYLAHMYSEFTYGKDSLHSLLKADKNRIFAYYRKSPESPVVDTKETNLYQLLNANSYQKGSWVLHMLRQKIGDQAFTEGIQTYFKTFCHSSAETNDFKEIIEKVSGQELDTFFRIWLFQPGHPVIEGDWKYAGFGKKLKFELQQTQENGQLYDLDIEVGVYYEEDEAPEILNVKLKEKSHEYEFKLKSQPFKVVLDPMVKILMDTHFTSK